MTISANLPLRSVPAAAKDRAEARLRSYPTSKEQQLLRLRRAERSCSMLKVRRGGREEIPLVPGKEQRLRSA